MDRPSPIFARRASGEALAQPRSINTDPSRNSKISSQTTAQPSTIARYAQWGGTGGSASNYVNVPIAPARSRSSGGTTFICSAPDQTSC